MPHVSQSIVDPDSKGLFDFTFYGEGGKLMKDSSGTLTALDMRRLLLDPADGVKAARIYDYDRDRTLILSIEEESEDQWTLLKVTKDDEGESLYEGDSYEVTDMADLMSGDWSLYYCFDGVDIDVVKDDTSSAAVNLRFRNVDGSVMKVPVVGPMGQDALGDALAAMFMRAPFRVVSQMIKGLKG